MRIFSRIIRSFLLFTVFIICTLCNSVLAQTENVDTEYAKGQIIDGYKSGIWEFYSDDKSLELKINFDEGSLVYLKPDTSEYFIYIDSIWRYSTVVRHSRYIGSYNEFYQILANTLQYPEKARSRKIQRTIYLQFDINIQGKATNLKVLNDPDEYFTKTIIDSFQQVPNFWISSYSNNQYVPSRFILPIVFKLDSKTKKRINHDVEVYPKPEGKYLSEILVVGYAMTTRNIIRR